MYDAIIIGSGAGGAPIAHVLVKQNKVVLVIEKGPLIRAQSDTELSQFKRDELISDGVEKVVNINVSNRGQPFYNSHVEPDINDEPHIYKDGNGQDVATIEGYTAQCVGGGTNLYGGVSLRFTPTDFALQSFNAGRSLKNDPNGDVERECRNWPYDYNTLLPFYERTEEVIGINGTSANQLKPWNEDKYLRSLQPNPISIYAFDGMTKLGNQLNSSNPAKPYRTPLAVITEDHLPSGRKVPTDAESIKTSYVNRYGDPLGFKSSTWVSLLSPIEKLPNLTIKPNCVVTHISSQNGKVNKVFYLNPDGTPQEAEGKIVVVACSAIESVRLLKVSALLNQDFDQRINQNNLLGKYFLTHAFGGASGLIPNRVDKSVALDSDWATDCCNNDKFLKDAGLWAGATIYNNTSDSALPLSLFRTKDAMDLDMLWKGLQYDMNLRGDKITDFLDKNFGRRLSISYMANQVPQFNNRIDLHSSIKDKWNRPVAYINKSWHSHDIALMDTIAKNCGEVLRLAGMTEIGFGSSYGAVNGLIRIANHVLGGARFGTAENDSVLDMNCRAWHFDNLYVTDGSFMPTSGSGNPTHTIEANSFRVADYLLTIL
ncbi:GMC family oxidoreductase [Arcicella aquatica]|uniref:GMC family oxidoreductase n=1 Tax=Arcicella aquatica TaxID=217141 RepID=A0ABU5QPZ3_9BACT|nr:GMC family oxidoreductase [Arcicella aquatica]MEA5259157.1 GMC family oxidoreductase [Arcicella aquatica]